MPAQSIDERLTAKLAAQEKLKGEIASLKQEKVKRDKAERQRLERKLGRLAIQYELHLLTEEQLAAVLQRARLEVLNLPKDEASESDVASRDNELLADTAEVGV